jgi:hypothetical protein
MKKSFIYIALIAVAASCGLAEKKEQKVEDLGISITVPTDKKIRPIAASEYSMASASFYIDKIRFEIREQEEKSMPTDLAMLEEAIKSADGFKAVTESKSLPNGAFGVVYETNKGKNFVFYHKIGTRYYRITPVFNNEGTYFAEGIEAIGTIK